MEIKREVPIKSKEEALELMVSIGLKLDCPKAGREESWAEEVEEALVKTKSYLEKDVLDDDMSEDMKWRFAVAHAITEMIDQTYCISRIRDARREQRLMSALDLLCE